MSESLEVRAHNVSVDVTRNTKGYTIAVTVRDDDDEAAYGRAVALMERLESRFPAADDVVKVKG